MNSTPSTLYLSTTERYSHTGGDESDEEEDKISGFPLNLANIAFDTSDFSRDEVPITRSMDIPMDIPCLYQPKQCVEHNGMVFHPASQKAFVSHHRQQRKEAPKLPAFWKVQRSSFRTIAPLSTVLEDLEKSFADNSIHWEFKGEMKCIFSCSSLIGHEEIEFNVHIFSVSATTGDLLVDIQLLQGCRFAFMDMLRILEPCLRCCPIGSLVSPQLERTRCLQSLPPLPQKELDSHLLTASEPLLDMIQVDGESNRDEACRALACLSKQPDAASMFFDAEIQRETALLTAICAMFESCSNVLVLSMIANLAVLDLASNLAAARLSWFTHLLESGSFQSALDGDCPHVRREALRTLASFSEMEHSLHSKIVNNPVWSFVKIKAEEGHGNCCTDLHAVEYARRIVAVCVA